MIRSLTIQNFRGLKDVVLDPLTRINLITGKNNSGKTSLLEALYLLERTDDFEANVFLHQLRGLAVSGSEFHRFWLFLFPDSEPNHRIIFQSVDEVQVKRTTELILGKLGDYPEQFPFTKQLGENPELAFSTDDPCFVAKYSDSDGISRLSVAYKPPKGARFDVLQSQPSPILSRFVATSQGDQSRDILDFSAIEVEGRQEELLRSLRLLEPRLKRISLVKVSGRDLFVGDIGKKQQVPIGLMGEGMRRLLSINLAIALCPRGMVLIDEVETGLHYSVQQKVWEAIGFAAALNKSQIFATTHSYECIQAAQRAFADNGEDDLTLIRLEKTGDTIKPVVINEEGLETAMEYGWEIR